MLVERLAVIAGLFCSLLHAHLFLGIEEVCFEIHPRFFLWWLFIPFLTVIEEHACFEYQIVRLGQNLSRTIWLIAILGKLLTALNLVDEHFEWGCRVPIGSKYFVVGFQGLWGDFPIDLE